MELNHRFFLSLFMVSLFFAFACSLGRDQEQLKVFEGFPVVIDLHGTPVMTGDEKFNPLLMGLKDNLLVICDVENGPHFHVYALPEFKYLGHFGQQGRGPSEFQNPLFWGQFEKSERVKAWIYDVNSLTLSLVDVLDAINDVRYKAERTFVLPNEASDAFIVLKIAGNNLIGSGAIFQGEFFSYDTEKNQIQWISQNHNYNKSFRQLLETTISFSDLLTLKQGIVKIKPDQLRFAKALVYAPIIDVYKPDGSLDFTIIRNEFDLPVLDDREINNTKAWYENVFLTDSYIYALNRNCTVGQFVLNECHNAEIHVFNWNGEPVALLRLNEGIGPAAPFVVDEVNKKIYTVNPRADNQVFSIFDYSQFSF